jgi:CBS domain-containing protein
MQIQQIMSKSVEYIGADTPISTAAQKMRDKDIGFVPICDNDRLVGTITDRDIVIRAVAQGRDPRTTPVREVMTQEVFYCYSDENVEHVGEVMRENEVRRMLILNRQKRLVGVISLGDIAKASGQTSLAGETLGQIAEAA